MVTKTRKRKAKGSKNGKRFIGKPGGQIQERVQAVGPERFGIVAVDCAKRRSKWMLCDFYGRVIVEPTTVEHTAGGLRAMVQLVSKTCEAEGLIDTIAAVEMTGIYHKPVLRAFRDAKFDTRIVHPFASSHYRQPLHPNQKTDDNDLEAIFQAAVKGYGLATFPVGEVYESLKSLARHRHRLVKQRSRVQIQIRYLLHQTMPGYAEQFDEKKLFVNSVAIPIALQFPSADAIRQAGVDAMVGHLRDIKVRYKRCTLERIVAWSRTAAASSELAVMHTHQWKGLNAIREILHPQILEIEREMAGFLVQTPYILLLSVTGINVVSAGRLAGEAGPIQFYASPRALTGRAGLYPSRSQSDEVDHPNGPLVRQCNRKLRGATTLIAKNLIKCHPYYRGLSALLESRDVAAGDRHCRIANRSMRMVFHLVSGRQLWRGQGVDREYLLAKLHTFHREHKTSVEQTIRDMHKAFSWLPKSAYGQEAKPLADLARKKRRGPQPIGELLVPLLARLGVTIDDPEDRVESNTSEARSSD